MSRRRPDFDSPALVSGFGALRWPTIAIGLATAVFLLLPILVIIPVSFSESDFLTFPPEGLSLRSYDAVTSDPIWREALWASIQIATVAALIATVTGTAAALGVRRLGSGAGGWLRTLFIAPIVLPYVVYGLGLFNLFDGLRMIGQIWPIAVGQAVLAFPIVFIAVSAALSQLDPALVRAAESLGARWPTVIWRVELPPVRLTIVAAAVFAFAFAFDEIVVALFLAAPETQTLPVAIYSEVLASASPKIAAVSAIVMVFACILIGAAAVLMSRAARRARA